MQQAALQCDPVHSDFRVIDVDRIPHLATERVSALSCCEEYGFRGRQIQPLDWQREDQMRWLRRREKVDIVGGRTDSSRLIYIALQHTQP